jgi:hypothetical protein
MQEKEEDRLFRHLRRSTFEEVHQAVLARWQEEYSNPNHDKHVTATRVARKHGWTYKEYIEEKDRQTPAMIKQLLEYMRDRRK